MPVPAAGTAALVTGASSGLGAELARALARRGHDLVLVARRRDRLEELAAGLAADGVRCAVLPRDLTDAGAREGLPGEVAAHGVEVTVLVNCAGAATAGEFAGVPVPRQVAHLRLDLEAAVDLCGRFVPGMVAAGRGGVLDVCSLLSVVPMPRMAVHAAAKAALLSFSEALHAELRPAGVAVTALCPGTVRTEFMERAGLGEAVGQLPAWALDDGRRVAERGLRALDEGRRVVVPSPLYRLSVAALRTAPHGPLVGALARRSPFPARVGPVSERPEGEAATSAAADAAGQ
ncbi:SDR family NAD(P)-dependent oxidoreductase [Geodermatophilus sp. SYSU D00758]